MVLRGSCSGDRKCRSPAPGGATDTPRTWAVRAAVSPLPGDGLIHPRAGAPAEHGLDRLATRGTDVTRVSYSPRHRSGRIDLGE